MKRFFGLGKRFHSKPDYGKRCFKVIKKYVKLENTRATSQWSCLAQWGAPHLPHHGVEQPKKPCQLPWERVRRVCGHREGVPLSASWDMRCSSIPVEADRIVESIRNGIITICNFALQKTASENASRFPVASRLVRENLYVNINLDSFDSKSSGITITFSVTSVLELGGFKLTKWLSSSR